MMLKSSVCSVVGLLMIVVMQASAATLTNYEWNLRTKESCMSALFEQDQTDATYKSLKAKVQDGIRHAYKDNTNFWSVKVKNFVCNDDQKVYVDFTLSTNTSKTSFGIASMELKNDLKDGILNGSNLPVYNELKEGSAISFTPKVYTVLKTEILNSHFCSGREEFKKQLASRLVSSKGIRNIQSSQILFSFHQCNDAALKFKKAVPQFYVTSVAGKLAADVSLNIVAYRLIDQMVYDGSTWKLGLTFHKRVESVKSGGPSAYKEDGLSDTEIIFIGFGLVLALIVIIVIVVLLSECFCGCRQGDGKNAEFYEMEEPVQNENGYTNKLYENEKEEPLEKNSPVYNDVVGERSVPAQVVVDVKASCEAPVETAPLVYLEKNAPYASDEDTDSDGDDGEDLDLHDLNQKKNASILLTDEFNKLPNKLPTALIYPNEVATKNRSDTFPWPSNRVVLKGGYSDYINASYIKNSEDKNTYIATQGPLQSTVNDFWKMIWQEQRHIIVAVTPLTQNGCELCHQYWPADSIRMYYGDISVKLVNKELKHDYALSTLSVEYQGQSLAVQLFRYMTWLPTSDIPESVKSIVFFMLEIKDLVDETTGLPVVHCSTGIGMTGVLLAINEGITMLENTQKVNIKKIVRLLRKELPCAVSTAAHYKFIHQVLHEYATYLHKHEYDD